MGKLNSVEFRAVGEKANQVTWLQISGNAGSHIQLQATAYYHELTIFDRRPPGHHQGV
jgi:hypothetical protein